MTFKNCSIKECSFGKLAIESKNLELCCEKGLQIFINLFNRGDKMNMSHYFISEDSFCMWGFS